MKKLIFLFVTIGSIVAGCDRCEREDFKPERVFTIEGNILNSDNGEPISGMMLRLQGPEAGNNTKWAIDRDTADEKGYFKLQYTKKDVFVISDRTTTVYHEDPNHIGLPINLINSLDTTDIKQNYFFPSSAQVDFSIINKDFFSDDDTLFIFFNWIERIKNIDVVDTFYVKAIGDFSNPFNYELEGYIFSKEEVLKFSNESFIVQGQNYYFPQGWFTKFQGFAGIGIKSVEEFMNGDRNYSETDNPHTFNVLLEEHNESYQVEIDIAKLEK
jgi:hypothetical protein